MAKTENDRSELIRKISALADSVTLEYVKELSEKISDPEADNKDKQKAFREMDKVLRIAKQYSDRVLLAEGKATENIGVGGMPFNVTFTKTYEGLPPETDDVTGDRCESDE